VTWSDATHWFDAPRLAFSWRPTADVAWRFALGSSIAPPYINLLSAQGGTPIPNAGGGATAYTVNANNGQVAPEKAFGYDLGIDLRPAPRLRVSSDVYLTNVRDLFLNETTQSGTYTPSAGADKGNTEPLYITQTGNVGHARYEGVELETALVPLSGIGFKLQGRSSARSSTTSARRSTAPRRARTRRTSA
jgi:outer membrane receptor for ferrienterochelin and colicin